jgi:hypothetical protein
MTQIFLSLISSRSAYVEQIGSNRQNNVRNARQGRPTWRSSSCTTEQCAHGRAASAWRDRPTRWHISRTARQGSGPHVGRSIRVRRSIFRTVSQGTSISRTVRQGSRLMILSLSRACSASVRASHLCSPCSLRWKEAAGSVHARGGNGRNARVGGREGACKVGWELGVTQQ